MDRYSRAIAFLKVVLPLAALALLSTLFLISNRVTGDPVIPFARTEIEDRLRGQQITAPYFTGTTDDGHEITMAASKALPGAGSDGASATDLEAEIQVSDGRSILLMSDEGHIRPDLNQARLAGNVRIITADGMRVETDELTADLGVIDARSPGKIRATGPLGALDAGAMHLFTKTQSGAVHIEFTQGVKLVYDPAKEER